jgi:Na+-transporting NADH:ubiquinone oxidoreductase subunit NqrB
MVFFLVKKNLPKKAKKNEQLLITSIIFCIFEASKLESWIMVFGIFRKRVGKSVFPWWGEKDLDTICCWL